MATIVMTTRGTFGDHFPFMMVGQELKRRGHRVRFGINRPMQAFAEEFDLECFDCGPVMGIEEAQEGAACWNYWNPPEPSCHVGNLRVAETYRSLIQVCGEADLLICASNFFMGAIIQHVLHVPLISICLAPAQVCAPMKGPFGVDTDNSKLAGWREIFEEMHKRFYRELEEIRQNLLDLPNIMFTDQWWEDHLISRNLVLAASPHFAKPVGKYDGALTAGFIFYEGPQWREWRPDPEQELFVEQKPSPLVLSFSSLPLQDPRRVMEIHAAAAQKLGRRLLVQKGWAGFEMEHIPSNSEKDGIMLVDFLPHDWVFSRAAAVIHHGGTGTTGRALRNGCPMLIEPYGNDQFFNARRVLGLTVGAAMHPFELTAEGLARVLEEKVLRAQYRRNAEALKEKISAEDGIQTICDFVEGMV